MSLKKWSFSQTKEFRKCERRWYLTYGLRSNIRSRDPLLKEVAFLKKIRPSWMWKGNLVHEGIATLLRKVREKGKPLSDIDLHRIIDAWLINQWNDSLRRTKERDPRTHISPAGPILFEHYFGISLDHKLIRDEVHGSIDQFLSWARETNLYLKMHKASSIWIDPLNSPGFQIDNVMFTTKIDLAFRTDNSFHIFDWKVSTPPQGNFNAHPERQQIGTYALWPYLELKIPVENIQMNIVYLSAFSANTTSVSITEDDAVLVFADAVLCVDAAKNILTNLHHYKIEDFDYASSVETCKHCAFQELCQNMLIGGIHLG